MISNADKENVRKAHEIATQLVDELKGVACSKNALLAELGVDILRSVTEIEQKLKRISLANQSES